MPTPAVKFDDTRDPKPDTHRRPGESPRAHLERLYRADPHIEDDYPPTQTHMAWRSLRVALSIVIILALMLAGVWRVHNALGAERATPSGEGAAVEHRLLASPAQPDERSAEGRQELSPKPIKAPAALVKARQQCPLDKPLACRAALVHALAAVDWQRVENLKLARLMVGNVTAWTCIHNGKGAKSGTGEGPWNDRGDPYWGGLQMDKQFMREYGADMIRRHHGGLADTWTPREQLIVAQRAFAQGRGYAPWPTTGRACGLL